MVCGRDKSGQTQNPSPPVVGGSWGKKSIVAEKEDSARRLEYVAERRKSDDGQVQDQKGVCVVGEGPRFFSLLFISKKTP